MRRFRVQGWYRDHDEKDFMWDYFFGETANEAIDNFKLKYGFLYFYKIEIIELRLREI